MQCMERRGIQRWCKSFVSLKPDSLWAGERVFRCFFFTTRYVLAGGLNECLGISVPLLHETMVTMRTET